MFFELILQKNKTLTKICLRQSIFEKKLVEVLITHNGIHK